MILFLIFFQIQNTDLNQKDLNDDGNKNTNIGRYC